MRRRLAGALVALLGGIATIVGTTAGAPPAAAAGPGVLLLGDSVLAAFNYGYGAGGVAAIAAAYSPTVDAVVCRRLTTAGCKPGAAQVSALQVLQAQRGHLPPSVVVTVGYNERDNMAAKIDAIMREALTGGAKRVVWLTYQNLLDPVAYTTNNAALVAAVPRWPQLRMGDWRAYSAGRTSWFSATDGVHLTGAGATAYGTFIRSQLDAAGAAAPADPRCSASLAIGAPTAPGVLAPDPPPSGARLSPVTPARLADTRAGWPGVGTPARVGAGRAVEVAVAGHRGVPTDAVGVIVNVTVVDPCGAGFATVFPSIGAGLPITSTTNFRAGETVAALAVVRLGPTGAIAVYTAAQADVLVDVVGYLHPSQGARFNPIEPVRVHDSRPSAVGAGQEVAVAVRGAGGGTIPSGAGVTGAALNLTVAEAAAGGYLTVYPGPCSPAKRPNASNLNFAAGATIANLVVTGLGTDGTVCVFSSSQAKVIVDATGWLGSTGSSYLGVNPQRVVDSRATAPSMHPEITGRLGAVPLAVPVGPSSGVPADATGVIVNVTVVAPSAGGWLVAYPCGSPQPPTSNVNFGAGENRPNLVAVRIGAGDSVCLASSAPTDVIVDLAGWFA